MPIEVKCQCGRRLRARDDLAGKRARCPACGVAVRIPAPGATVLQTATAPTPAPAPRVSAPAPAPAPAPARVAAEAFPHTPDVNRSMPVLADHRIPEGLEAPDPYSLAGDDQEPLFEDPSIASPSFGAAATTTFMGTTIAIPMPSTVIVEPPEEEEEESEKPAAANATAGLRRFAYLLLVLALLPLALHTFLPHESVFHRFVRTLRSHPELSRHIEDGDRVRRSEVTAILSELPGERLDGAHTSRHTSLHYLYALLSAAGFFSLAMWVMPGRSTGGRQVFLVGLFTGTAGILLLLGVQLLATSMHGHIYIRGGIVGLFLLIFQLIGLSYYAALSPNTSFLGSFLGFTFGVGLCEELCKALPVLWNIRTRASLDWRGAFQWGLLSGVGFGVSEAITYAADYYNGIDSGGVYLVRFISCVALHGAWSAAAAVSIYRRQHVIQSADHWFSIFFAAALLVAVPMVLHGLYDTMLKKEMGAGALVVALLSFAYLAYEVESIRRMDERGVVPRGA